MAAWKYFESDKIRIFKILSNDKIFVDVNFDVDHDVVLDVDPHGVLVLRVFFDLVFMLVLMLYIYVLILSLMFFLMLSLMLLWFCFGYLLLIRE